LEAVKKPAGLSQPIAAIGNPPTEEENWNGGAQCPPERKKKISHYTQDRENGPKDFPFHASSLQPLSRLVSRTRENNRAAMAPFSLRSLNANAQTRNLRSTYKLSFPLILLAPTG
jgi:hypothetical protein